MGDMVLIIRGIEDRFGAAAALVEASRYGELGEVKRLVDEGADVNEPYGNGVAIILAAFAGRTRVVDYLIKAGADVNALSPYDGSTPLIMCLGGGESKRSRLATASRLLKAGAKTGVVNERGETAMDWAKKSKSARLIELIESYSQ